MKFMTKLETIIMNRTGCNREIANLVANDILVEADKESAREVLADLAYVFNKQGVIPMLNRMDELEEKYGVKS